MKYATQVKCPDCAGKFRIPQGDPFPNFCPLCGSYVGVDPDFVPSRLNMPSALGRSADWSYRKLEADSEARAEAARPMIEQQLVAAGIPLEEAQRQSLEQSNAIKVTNIRDHMNEGDVAAIPSEYRPSAQYEAQVSQLGGDPRGSFAGGMAVAGAGPAPVQESGAKVLAGIQAGRTVGPPGPASVAGMGGGFGRI